MATRPRFAADRRLGDLLRHWRELRSLSQLALSDRAGVSQRHISFVESGRSLPSRDVLDELAEALDVPLRDRNALLLSAGYAPTHAETLWDAPQMHAVTAAVRRMLQRHEPFPAVALDRYWNVLLANDASPAFFNHFIDMHAWKGPRNILHLMFDPAGMRPFIVNWDQIAPALIRRVYREALGRSIDPLTERLLAELRVYPDVPSHRPDATEDSSADAVIPLRLRLGSDVLSYFSLVAIVGTPYAVAAQELRVECMFPADRATEERHLALVQSVVRAQ